MFIFAICVILFLILAVYALRFYRIEISGDLYQESFSHNNVSEDQRGKIYRVGKFKNAAYGIFKCFKVEEGWIRFDDEEQAEQKISKRLRGKLHGLSNRDSIKVTVRLKSLPWSYAFYPWSHIIVGSFYPLRLIRIAHQGYRSRMSKEKIFQVALLFNVECIDIA